MVPEERSVWAYNPSLAQLALLRSGLEYGPEHGPELRTAVTEQGQPQRPRPDDRLGGWATFLLNHMADPPPWFAQPRHGQSPLLKPRSTVEDVARLLAQEWDRLWAQNSGRYTSLLPPDWSADDISRSLQDKTVKKMRIPPRFMAQLVADVLRTPIDLVEYPGKVYWAEPVVLNPDAGRLRVMQVRVPSLNVLELIEGHQPDLEPSHYPADPEPAGTSVRDWLLGFDSGAAAMDEALRIKATDPARFTALVTRAHEIADPIGDTAWDAGDQIVAIAWGVVEAGETLAEAGTVDEAMRWFGALPPDRRSVTTGYMRHVTGAGFDPQHRGVEQSVAAAWSALRRPDRPSWLPQRPSAPLTRAGVEAWVARGMRIWTARSGTDSSAQRWQALGQMWREALGLSLTDLGRQAATARARRYSGDAPSIVEPDLTVAQVVGSGAFGELAVTESSVRVLNALRWLQRAFPGRDVYSTVEWQWASDRYGLSAQQLAEARALWVQGGWRTAPPGQESVWDRLAERGLVRPVWYDVASSDEFESDWGSDDGSSDEGDELAAPTTSLERWLLSHASEAAARRAAMALHESGESDYEELSSAAYRMVDQVYPGARMLGPGVFGPAWHLVTVRTLFLNAAGPAAVIDEFERSASARTDAILGHARRVAAAVGAQPADPDSAREWIELAWHLLHDDDVPFVGRDAEARDVNAISFAAAAEEFERNLGNYLTGHPIVVDQLQVMVDAVLSMIPSDSDDRLALAGPDGATPGGVGVGHREYDLTAIERVRQNGNVREQFALLWQGLESRLFDGLFGLSTEDPSELADDRRDVRVDEDWSQIDAMLTQFAELPSSEPEVLPWAKQQQASFWITVDPDRLRPPLSLAERRAALQQGRLTWIPTWHVQHLGLDSDTYRRAAATGALINTGSSPLAYRFMLLAKALFQRGVAIDRDAVVMVLLAGLLPVQENTFHEVIRAVLLVDPTYPYQDSRRRYRTVSPMLSEDEIRQHVATDGLFPDEHADEVPDRASWLPDPPVVELDHMREWLWVRDAMRHWDDGPGRDQPPGNLMRARRHAEYLAWRDLLDHRLTDDARSLAVILVGELGADPTTQPPWLPPAPTEPLDITGVFEWTRQAEQRWQAAVGERNDWYDAHRAASRQTWRALLDHPMTEGARDVVLHQVASDAGWLITDPTQEPTPNVRPTASATSTVTVGKLIVGSKIVQGLPSSGVTEPTGAAYDRATQRWMVTGPALLDELRAVRSSMSDPDLPAWLRMLVAEARDLGRGVSEEQVSPAWQAYRSAQVAADPAALRAAELRLAVLGYDPDRVAALYRWVEDLHGRAATLPPPQPSGAGIETHIDEMVALYPANPVDHTTVPHDVKPPPSDMLPVLTDRAEVTSSDVLGFVNSYVAAVGMSPDADTPEARRQVLLRAWTTVRQQAGPRLNTMAMQVVLGNLAGLAGPGPATHQPPARRAAPPPLAGQRSTSDTTAPRRLPTTAAEFMSLPLADAPTFLVLPGKVPARTVTELLRQARTEGRTVIPVQADRPTVVGQGLVLVEFEPQLARRMPVRTDGGTDLAVLADHLVDADLIPGREGNVTVVHVRARPGAARPGRPVPQYRRGRATPRVIRQHVAGYRLPPTTTNGHLRQPDRPRPAGAAHALAGLLTYATGGVGWRIDQLTEAAGLLPAHPGSTVYASSLPGIGPTPPVLDQVVPLSMPLAATTDRQQALDDGTGVVYEITTVHGAQSGSLFADWTDGPLEYGDTSVLVTANIELLVTDIGSDGKGRKVIKLAQVVDEPPTRVALVPTRSGTADIGADHPLPSVRGQLTPGPDGIAVASGKVFPANENDAGTAMADRVPTPEGDVTFLYVHRDPYKAVVWFYDGRRTRSMSYTDWAAFVARTMPHLRGTLIVLVDCGGGESFDGVAALAGVLRDATDADVVASRGNVWLIDGDIRTTPHQTDEYGEPILTPPVPGQPTTDDPGWSHWPADGGPPVHHGLHLVPLLAHLGRPQSPDFLSDMTIPTPIAWLAE